MSQNQELLSQYVNISPRFSRSINLMSDRGNMDSSRGYIVTENVATVLDTLCSSLAPGQRQRSFALLGPYGVGKSAFSVFISQLFGDDKNLHIEASHQISSKYEKLAGQVQKLRAAANDRGFLIIAVTARRQNIAQLLLQGIYDVLAEFKKDEAREKLANYLDKVLREESWSDTATVLEALKQCHMLALKKGYAGITLIVDEVGKTLEYALQDAAGGDVYLFQEIAEYANRSGDKPLLFLINLHQMFDDYAAHSSRTVQNEWGKVQERFQSIQFRESAWATMQMVSQSIVHSQSIPKEAKRFIADTLEMMERNNIPLPLGVEYTEFAELAEQAWPIHPVTLLAMPYIFRRLAQNERSIFSYLSSREPFSFSSHLKQRLDLNYQSHPFVCLYHIYDYLLANFEGSLARIPFAKRLLEANDIIKSRSKLTTQQLQIIQSVALLNVLGDVSNLKATREMLSASFSPRHVIKKHFEELKCKSFLVYRKLDSAYRIWEGSDVDLEQRLIEARKQLQISGTSLLATLGDLLPKRNLVAKRHSLETGIHRYFNVAYADVLSPSLLKEISQVQGAVGTVVVLFAQEPQRAEAEIKDAVKAHNNLIVAVPKQIDAIRQLVDDIASLRWVIENTPDLRDDRITRREIALRLSQSEQRIDRLLQVLLDPRSAPKGNSCRWYSHYTDQEVLTPVDVTRLLSNVCDLIFYDGVCLKNELVVRDKISAAAASARRMLIEKMFLASDQENLGIEGYPPERSIYESILKVTGIHRMVDGQWQLCEPLLEDQCQVWNVWRHMEQRIFHADARHMSLKELFDELSKAPFGVPSGVHAILFVAFYLVHQDELFLYRENSFLASLEVAHLELLQKRPDLFSCSGVKLAGPRLQVVERLAKGLLQQQAGKVASVVRALFGLVARLSPVTHRSNKLLSAQTIRFRSVLQAAESPEKLLFTDLPKAMGLAPLSEKASSEQDVQVEQFFNGLNTCLAELHNHEERLRKKCRGDLLVASGFSESDENWQNFLEKCRWLAPKVNMELLNPVLQASLTADGKKGERLILSFIVSRPYDHWLDIDFEKFIGLAEGFGLLFQKAWEQYGEYTSILSLEDQEEKTRLEPLVNQLLHNSELEKNPKVVAAILREYARRLEK